MIFVTLGGVVRLSSGDTCMSCGMEYRNCYDTIPKLVMQQDSRVARNEMVDRNN